MGQYYDGGRLLGSVDLNGGKPEIYICTSNRTAGKTTYFSRYVINKWRAGQGKFMLLYRHINELDAVEDKFFKDVGKLFFPGLMMGAKKVAGGKFCNLYLAPALDYEKDSEIPWEHCGYAVPLNSADFVKKCSHLFSDTERILFDEFQPETGYYLKDETRKFISIHMSVARGNGKQNRYVPVYMLANPVTMLNPYYISMRITDRLDYKTRFLRGDGWVMEQGYVESAAKAQEESAFMRAFQGEQYTLYGTQGVYLHDDRAFVNKMRGRSRYMCSILHKKEKYCVRSFDESGIYYVAEGWDDTYPLKITSAMEEHQEGLTMLSRLSFISVGWKRAFEMGAFRFQTMKCKTALISTLYYK